MSDLTAKFAALEAQLAAQAEVTDALVDTVEPKLQAIFDQLDLMLVNNAANTKALLTALGQTGACFPCPTPSIVVPTIPGTETEETADYCRRVQAFIAAIHSILDAMDTLQSFNVIGTFNVLNDAISEVIGGLIEGEDVPLPSFPETVNIVGNYVSYAGERLFSGVGLIEQFAPLEDELRTALFEAGSVSGAPGAFNAIIDGSDVSLVGKLLIKSVGYAALYTYYLDPASTPDVSAFDGFACGDVIATCATLPRVIAHSTVFASDFGCIEWPTGWPRTNFYTRNSDTLSLPVVLVADLTGYSFTPHGGNVSLQDDEGAGTVNDNTEWNFDGTELEVLITCPEGVTIEFCGPDIPPPAR